MLERRLDRISKLFQSRICRRTYLSFIGLGMYCSPDIQRVVYVQYVAVCPLYEKLEFLDLKKTTFYQCLSKAQAELWSLMEVQNGVRKVREVREVPEQVC